MAILTGNITGTGTLSNADKIASIRKRLDETAPKVVTPAEISTPVVAKTTLNDVDDETKKWASISEDLISRMPAEDAKFTRVKKDLALMKLERLGIDPKTIQETKPQYTASADPFLNPAARAGNEYVNPTPGISGGSKPSGVLASTGGMPPIGGDSGSNFEAKANAFRALFKGKLPDDQIEAMIESKRGQNGTSDWEAKYRRQKEIDQEFANEKATESIPPVISSTLPSPGSSGLPSTNQTEKQIKDSYQAYMAKGDTKSAKYFADLFKEQFGYGIGESKPLTEEEKKLQSNKIAEEERNNKVAEAAKNYLDTYKKLLEAGDLNSEDAKRQLAFAAGKYNTIAGFGEGGKTLSASELGILAPTLLKTERQRDRNLIEKALGTQPEMTKGLLQESPDQAAEKMKLALKYTNPDLLKEYESITPSVKKTEIPQLIKNAGQDVKDILNGIANIPKAAKDGIEYRIAHGMPIDPFSLAGAAGTELVMGTINEYNNLLGKPFEGGDVVGRIGERAYGKPVTTVLDVLPAVGLLKKFNGVKAAGTVGEVGEAGQVINAVDDASLLSKARKAVGGAITEGTSALQELATPGTKEFISKMSRLDDPVTMSDAVMSENILAHPTTKGRIVASTKALEKTGSNIETILNKPEYKSITTADEIKSGLQTFLDDKYQNPELTRKVLATVYKYGDFDMPTGQVNLGAADLNKLKKGSYDYSAIAGQDPISGPMAKSMSRDVSSYVRQIIEDKVPEVTPEMRKYSALRTYVDDVLPDPNGASAVNRQSLIRAFGTAGEMLNQGAYNIGKIIKGAGLPDIPQQTIKTLPPANQNPLNYTLTPFNDIVKKKSPTSGVGR